jgi:flavin reductase (DIM6/NTAB) family NADH-FMN oxidoreductase RutF
MNTDDADRLKTIDQVLRMVDREVWIVTAATDNGRRGGLVATWISQASIDVEHPMIVAGIAPNHYTRELIDSAKQFAAHLVTDEQIELIWRFGMSSGRDHDKLAGLWLLDDVNGAPVLRECLAWLLCQVVGHYDAGDRIYYFAQVVDGARYGDAEPVRQRDLIARATPEQLRALQTAQLADVAALRPLHEAWLQAQEKTTGERPVRQ